MANTKILCVDDDERILNGISRQLGDDFDITIALGPHKALEVFDDEGPFAVVLSDMRMADINGVQLLSRIRERSPNTVRMILTGFAELNTTIEAINAGHIFRFLAKPCSTENLSSAFEAGLRQYALVESERELVEGTLYGSVKVLSEVLSLVSPLAFGQSTRVRATVDGVLKRLPIQNQWQLEIAAMLFSLGCVTLPTDLLEKKLSGQQLTAEENDIFRGHPLIAGELIRSIPRLDRVAEIIANQNTYSSSLTKSSDFQTSQECRILELAIEFDMHELNCESSLHALNEIKSNKEYYGDELIDAISDYVKAERNLEYAELMIYEIEEGMVLAEDIRNSQGILLMSKGQEITPSAYRLLSNFSSNEAIRNPIKIVVNKNSRPASVGNEE